MTKTERLRRARKIRTRLARFVDLQKPHVQEFVKSEWGSNPDYNAFNHLLFAKKELDDLIAELRAEGYGQ